MKKYVLASMLALAGIGSAAAETTTSTFQVNATVLKSCEISAADLTFTAFAPATAGGNEDASSSISVQCTNTTPYTIALDAGTGGGDVTTERLMTGPGADTLSYNLYTDAARSVIFGDGVAGMALAGTGDGSLKSEVVYGRIVKNQFVTPGNYSSTVGVTVTY